MDKQLISKKELLQLTGITYGQLYRWKRKKLIPEKWFMKQSSYTGQETFLPRDLVLERIEQILDLKDEKSLDELAATFTSKGEEISLTYDGLVNWGYIRHEVLKAYETVLQDPVDFNGVLALYINQELLEKGQISLEEGRRLIDFMKQKKDILANEPMTLKYVRKLGVGFWMLLQCSCPCVLETDVNLIMTVDLSQKITELNTKLQLLIK